MPKAASPHSHGRSEMWKKPALKKAIEKERKAFGKAVRKAREMRGISQEQLAELAGLHPNYVSRVENGAVNASLAAIVALAYGLKTTPAKLFSK